MTPATHELERLDVPALEANPYRAMLGCMTIARAADLWLGELARQGKAARTCDTYRRLLDKLYDHGDNHDKDVADVTAHDLRRFLDQWNGKADGTVAQVVTVLNLFFDWVTAEEIARRNPTRRNGLRILERPRLKPAGENDDVTTVSADEVRRLLTESLRYVPERWDEALAISVLVHMGPRRRALAQARICDYDQVERDLVFQEKGGKTIRKPVPDELADLIDRAILAGAYKSRNDYLVPSRADQRRKGGRDDRVIWRIVKQVAHRANVDTHVHALRAAFAVYYLEANPGRVIALQSLLGHARPETTQVYLRRLNRRTEMETVRSLSWQAPVFTANTGIGMGASRVAEKEGFEPSFDPMLLLERDGSQHAADAPREKLH